MCQTPTNNKQGEGTAVHWVRGDRRRQQRQPKVSEKENSNSCRESTGTEQESNTEKVQNQLSPQPSTYCFTKLIGKNYFIRTDQKSLVLSDLII